MCLHSYCASAGYEGVITEDLRRALKITRYQSSKATVTYADYVKERGSAGDCITQQTPQVVFA